MSNTGCVKGSVTTANWSSAEAAMAPNRYGLENGPSSGSVRARLQQIAAEYDADELVLLTLTHDDGARRRSYELLAEEYGLEP